MAMSAELDPDPVAALPPVFLLGAASTQCERCAQDDQIFHIGACISQCVRNEQLAGKGSAQLMRRKKKKAQSCD
jgi:hypothetical protein